MAPRFPPFCSRGASPASIACSAIPRSRKGRWGRLPTTSALATFRISTAAFDASTAPRPWISAAPPRNNNRPAGGASRGRERAFSRLCEASEAIHSFLLWQDGLLRCARNDGRGDGLRRCARNDGGGSFHAASHPPRHCEE